MNQTTTTNRFLVGLLLASVLFLIGVGLFTLKSIWSSGASPLDVSMELTLLPETTEVWAGEPVTHQIRYICASFTNGCENAVLTEQLPSALSWAQEDVQFSFNSEEIVSANYDETTGIISFTFVTTLSAATTGQISVTTMVPTATVSQTILDFQATLDWSNGSETQSSMQIKVLQHPIDEQVETPIQLPDTSGVDDIFPEATPTEMGDLPAEIEMMADQSATALIPVEDSYVDYFSPTQNFDGQPLTFEIAAPFVEDENGYCPTITKISYIKFDLSAVPFSIAQAELRLSPIDSCELANNGNNGLSTSLFTSSNDWSESEITWDNRPIPSMLLSDGVSFSNALNQPEVVEVDEASLANWLAMYQAKGEKIVTIGFISPLFMGCSPQSTTATKMMFQDTQQSSRSASCGVPAEAPHLYLASADGQLHPAISDSISPTAIQLSQTVSIASPLGAIVGIVLIGLTALTFISAGRRYQDNRNA